MKILYFTYALPKPNLPQGVYITNRVKYLIKYNIPVVLCTSSNLYSKYYSNKKLFQILKLWGKDYSLSDIGVENDSHVLNLRKIENPYNYFNLLKKINVYKLYKTFIKNNCDLIHAHFIRDGIYAMELKKKKNIPYVVTAHAYDIYDIPFKSKKLAKITNDVLNYANQVIFVSNAMHKIAQKLGYLKNNFEIIPNGYDAELFRFNTKNKRNIIISFVGTLNKIKRADLLPEIIFKTNKKLPDIVFWIIGEGSLRNHIVTKINEYHLTDKVRFFGHVQQENLSNLLSETNFIILPSKQEGFPTVIAEAIGSGAVPIVSNIPGSVEAVGNAGFIVENETNFVDSFVSKIVEAIKYPIAHHLIAERAKQLTWDTIIQQEINVYHNVLRK
jgi:teichuronic acid biosynthesis glycosyltransferase TuaC